MEHDSEDQKGKGYEIRLMKTRCIVTRMHRHVRATPISVEDDLRKEMSKANRPQVDTKLNQLMDHLALQNRHKYLKFGNRGIRLIP